MRQIAIVVQNLVFWPLFFAMSGFFIATATIIVTIISLVAPRRFVMRCVRQAIVWYGLTILRCGWPFVRVEYRDLVPEQNDGPYTFVCNHRSSSDPFLVACLRRECIQIVNVWPFKLPLLGPVAKIAGYISIMETPIDLFYEKIGRLLDKGVSIVSFPEGTRSATRKMGPFKSAIFRGAIRSHTTIVPVAISGNENIPHKGSLVLHPGRIRVHKLPAVTWEQYRNMNAFRLKNHIQSLLRKHLDQIENMVA